MHRNHTFRATTVRSTRLLAVCTMLALGFAPAANAADDPSDAGALSGPKVKPKDAEASLIERDFGGRLKRVESDPVLTALDRMSLDDATRNKIDSVVAERNAIVDRLVQDHLPLIVELNNARQSDDKPKVRELIGKLMIEARPLLARGSMADEIRPLLPEHQQAELTRMLGEYRSAALQDRMSGGESGGAPVARGEAATTEFLVGFGQEIKRSYERTFTARKAEFDAVLATLNLTPEQDAKIRGIVIDQFQKQQGKATPRERRRMFMQIYRELDAEQRTILVERLRERRGEGSRGERKPADAKPTDTKPDATMLD